MPRPCILRREQYQTGRSNNIGMSDNIFYSFVAFVSIIPAVVAAFGRNQTRNGAFWVLLGLAVIGPVIWLVVRSNGEWRTEFSTALWITVSATLLTFAATALISREGWRLSPIVMPYMAMLAFIAVIWENAGVAPPEPLDSPWIVFHIAISVLTYAIATTAACAAFAAFLKERALKNKAQTVLVHRLPSVSDCDTLQVGLLTLGEIILALGLITGVAASLAHGGDALPTDHKTVFAVLAFVVIGVLLLIHKWTGVRGRQAARLVLAAYLLLTLAYPGVKFVTDVLLS